MKALILAAGFGTRLLPYTNSLPKPLFTLNQRPVLDLAIERLIHCGCDKIFINTHHCHEQIDSFISQHRFKEMIQTVYEPKILDTGGAIANLRQLMNRDPFFVINADIISDVDLKQVYESHLASCATATLVLHDYPEFNKIQVDDEGFIKNFDGPAEKSLAFTGIQVLSQDIYLHMPKNPDLKIFSSIDVYKALCPAKKIKAHMAEQIFWKDIGTIPSYTQTSQQCLSASVLGLPENKIHEILINPIAGDGSDRLWFRAKTVAQASLAGEFSLSPAQKFETFYKEFSALKGIGDWTINYVAMRGLGMIDSFPASDLGVIKAVTKAGKPPSKKQILAVAENWRPFRSYATLCLWNSLG